MYHIHLTDVHQAELLRRTRLANGAPFGSRVGRSPYRRSLTSSRADGAPLDQSVSPR